jgi:hypothetical protein
MMMMVTVVMVVVRRRHAQLLVLVVAALCAGAAPARSADDAGQSAPGTTQDYAAAPRLLFARAPLALWRLSD